MRGKPAWQTFHLSSSHGDGYAGEFRASSWSAPNPEEPHRQIPHAPSQLQACAAQVAFLGRFISVHLRAYSPSRVWLSRSPCRSRSYERFPATETKQPYDCPDNRARYSNYRYPGETKAFYSTETCIRHSHAGDGFRFLKHSRPSYKSRKRRIDGRCKRHVGGASDAD